MKYPFEHQTATSTNRCNHFSTQLSTRAAQYTAMFLAVWLSPLTVNAQEQGADAETTEQTTSDSYDESLEEIVVTGTAANYRSSVLGKRAADGIVDMFNADEIGRLPDKNIGETLTRIPGVTMLLEKGVGRFVQIRGISPRLNNVTINGMAIGSVDTDEGGRAVPLDLISGSMLGSAQVFKTPTPDMDGTGIGGTLNLVTKKPFDFNEDFTVIGSAEAGYEDIPSVPGLEEFLEPKETSWSADATVAGKLLGGQLGWLAGAAYLNRQVPILGIYQDEWRFVTFDPDPNVPGDELSLNYPEATKNNVYIVGRERLNFNGMLELQPNDRSSYFIRSFYAKWDELQFRNRYNHGLSDRLTAVDNDSSGTISENGVRTDLRHEPSVKELFSVSMGGENDFDLWTVDYTGQYNDNNVEEPNTYWIFRSDSTAIGPDNFVVQDNGLVEVTSTGADPQDPALHTFSRVTFETKNSTEESYIAEVNALRDMSSSFSNVEEATLKFGAKWTQTDRDRNDSLNQYGDGSLGWNLATEASLNGGAFTNPVSIASQPNIWMDFSGLNNFFASNSSNPALFEFDEETTFTEQFQDDFAIRENILAGYIMGTVSFGITNLIGGVRVESTDVESSAYTIITEADTLDAVPVTGDGSYTSVLPALIATFDVGNDWVIRAAYTEAIGRPSFDALAPRSSLQVEVEPSVGTVGILSIGNPGLKARESSNYDLSFEWYFDEGSIASIALFYKDISNEIIGAPTQRFDDYSYLGQTFDRFEINTTMNAQTAYVKGIEATFSDVFDFLPSPFDTLGFAGNVTLLDSQIEIERNDVTESLPLLEQADSSVNVTVFYQNGPFDFSATYNRDDNFLTSLGQTRNQDLDQGAFERIDARLQYSINDNFKVFVSGSNLDNEPTTEFQGGILSQNTEYEYSGRTYSIGAAANF